MFQLANAAARKSLLESLTIVGRMGYNDGMKLAAVKAQAIAAGKVTADDMFGLGAINEGFQLQQMESAAPL